MYNKGTKTKEDKQMEFYTMEQFEIMGDAMEELNSFPQDDDWMDEYDEYLSEIRSEEME